MQPSYVTARIQKVRERLQASVSGYIRVAKVSSIDRTVLAEMKKTGEVEIFESPTGRAYRFAKKS